MPPGLTKLEDTLFVTSPVFRFVFVLFKVKPAIGVPFTVDTVLGEDAGVPVAEDTDPPASPNHPAGLRTVTPMNPPAWVNPALGAFEI